MASEPSEEPIAAVAQFFNAKRKPVTAKDRKAGPYPYYGAAAIQDWVSDYLFDGIFVLVGEDGTVQTGDGKLMVQLAQGRIWVNNHAHVLQCETEDDTRYLAYALTQVDAGPFITGAAQPKINMGNLKRVTIPWPAPDIRTGISTIGRSIDDRIDLLRQTNATLEAIAQALFKSWFVDFDPVRAKAEGREPEGMDAATAALFPCEFEESEMGFIPKGWKVLPLSEAFEINPRRAIKKGSVAPYLDMASVPTSGHVPAPPVDREFSSGTKFQNGDTLLARITPCLENGKTAHVDFLADEQVGWGSTEFIVLRPKPPLPLYFGYLIARHDAFRAFATQAMTGTSGRQRVELGQLERFQVVCPDAHVSTAFGLLVEPIRACISANQQRSEVLAKLRDTLLPRLISGKLRLPQAEAVEETSA